jgi:outer membrane immunogenic protein
MRRSAIASVLAIGLYIGLGTVAFAAKPHKPLPPPPPPAWSWTGFYVGANVGYGWGSSNVNESFFNATTGAFVGSDSGTVHPNGVIGGGQAGYNWQNGNWVWGLEADIQASGQQGTVTLVCPVCSASGNPVVTSLTEKLEWFGTVRPRLGWTVTPETMIYATGGLAYGELNDSGTISDSVATGGFDLSKTSVGWSAGGGVEGHLTGNWTWKVEYLFLTLEEPSGSALTAITPPGLRQPPGSTTTFDPIFTDNIVRVGVNYKWQ